LGQEPSPSLAAIAASGLSFLGAIVVFQEGREAERSPQKLKED
jgi:hypothetical protein